MGKGALLRIKHRDPAAGSVRGGNRRGNNHRFTGKVRRRFCRVQHLAAANTKHHVTVPYLAKVFVDLALTAFPAKRCTS